VSLCAYEDGKELKTELEIKMGICQYHIDWEDDHDVREGAV
jgi:hypothetical protein